MKPMVFEGTEIELITRDGEVWARGVQIAHALGYRDESAISRIYARNKDEFSDTMTCTVKLTDQHGQRKTTRIFSLRGAHLLAMFARTKKAKAFRRWVLDILDTIAKGGEYARQQWEQARQALDDRREQASQEGRGLAAWRWRKEPLEANERYWRDRMQLTLPL
ncbi:MAG: BRO family protein [Pseudomonadota bacterium]|jgi:prophage antirepressor-like protein|nr:BRO family protein [Pseudomonadota bacterium]